MSKSLRVENLSKSYIDSLGYRIKLLREVSFDIGSNQVTSILAPEGSGKSTLLKMLSGLEDINDGKFYSDFEKAIYIPSNPSSFPWLNVIDNIRVNSFLDNDSCQGIIDKVGLHGYESHFPHNDSIGFRFRVSLARAIANDADLILLDEPFTKLNSTTRIEIYNLIRSLNTDDKLTFFLGTSNISEAIYLSDKIILLSNSLSETIEDIEITLPDKREPKILESSEFAEIRNKIENILIRFSDKKFYSFSL